MVVVDSVRSVRIEVCGVIRPPCNAHHGSVRMGDSLVRRGRNAAAAVPCNFLVAAPSQR